MTTLGGLSIVYGLVLCLFWALAAVWIAARPPLRDAASFAIVLASGLIAVLLVATGVALCRAGSGRRSPPRALAFVTAGCLAAKAAVAGCGAGVGLSATGSFAGIGHAVGLVVLVTVVAPSAVWAVALVSAVKRSDARPWPSAALKRRTARWATAAALAAVGVIGFVVVRNAGQGRERVAAVGRLPTAAEFRARWVGATKDDLEAAVGRPSEVIITGGGVDAPSTYRVYIGIARNPASNRVYNHVGVHVSREGRVTGVEFR